jgi:integrase/recombinase XerD
VVEIDALLKKAGLPASYGNKATKAEKLIDWRACVRAEASRRLARATHELSVRNALTQRRYHGAIAEGKMTVEQAGAIIQSAGLDVPASLTAVPASEPVKRKGGRATRALEDGEIRAMFAAITGRYAQRDRAMLMCGIHLALRASELCGLSVGDVSDGNQVRTYITIRGENAKRGKERIIRIGDDVMGVIADFIRWKAQRGESIERDAPLFQSQMGGHLSRITLFVIVTRILKTASIEQSPHCLRKTGATIYYQQSGYDVMATQTFLGHANPSVTRRYIGITPEQASEYAQRASQALVSAAETGKSEKLNTMHQMFNFSISETRDELKRLKTELERKDNIIDHLLSQLDQQTVKAPPGPPHDADDKVILLSSLRKTTTGRYVETVK